MFCVQFNQDQKNEFLNGIFILAVGLGALGRLLAIETNSISQYLPCLLERQDNALDCGRSPLHMSRLASISL